MVDVQQLRATQDAANDERVKGAVTGPALPASTVPGTNTTGKDLICRISSGTVTVVAVDGVVLAGVTTGEWFFVHDGSTFAITYSVAPTLQWFEK